MVFGSIAYERSVPCRLFEIEEKFMSIWEVSLLIPALSAEEFVVYAFINYLVLGKVVTQFLVVYMKSLKQRIPYNRP